MVRRSVGFVMGGGGHNGAAEVGMLRALFESGITPNLVLGTSVGAVNGAAIAHKPSLDGVKELRETWLTLEGERIFGGSMISSAAYFVRSRTHLHSNLPFRRLLERTLPPAFEDLTIPFQCVAACIERASEHWFETGPLAEAILASAALPGVLPPVEIDGEHFVDGGIVNSIPISRAVELGAREIYILQAGRVETQLTPPRTPLQVALVTFEIARRHRFSRDLASLPKGVTAHVLPTGEPKKPSLSQLNYKDFRHISRRIDRAYKSSMDYLRSVVKTPTV